MTGSGTSHRVNSILVTINSPETNQEVEEGEEEYCRPTKRKCRRSLPPEAVSSEIPDYYGGKRVGPGKLNEVKNLSQSCSYLKFKRHSKIEIHCLDRSTKAENTPNIACSWLDGI